MSVDKPEIAKSIKTGDFNTNYHDVGEGGFPALFIHGSGPGVTAWANWRLVLPIVSKNRRVIAPDMVGFGYTERPEGIKYSMDVWVKQVLDLMDALNIEQTDLVGNSFGGALALTLVIEHPERFRKLVLMGSMGVDFPITYGLNEVWGYEPSLENMKKMLGLFAYSEKLKNDDALANLRYNASIEKGFQESFSAMFPAPRQRWVEAMARHESEIPNIKKPTLIIHGREDKVIPVENSLKIFNMILDAQLHIFGKCGHWTQIEQTQRFCTLVDDFFNE